MLPHDYLSTKGYGAIANRHLKLLMGHNRWATRGKINNASAHPFEFENVIGAHNGTLRGQYLLPDSTDYDLDSENLFHAIDIDGIDATWSRTDGAAALVFFDKKKNSLNFIRNDERSFFYCFGVDRKSMFWASEAWMLTGLLARNNIKHTQVVSTAENNLYTLSLDTLRTNEVLDKFHIRKLKEYLPRWGNTNTTTTPAKVTNIKDKQIAHDAMRNRRIGSQVVFKVTEFESNGKTRVICGHESLDANVPVRIFVSRNKRKKMIELLSDPKKLFVGKVNNISPKGELLVQDNSVEEYFSKKVELEGEDEDHPDDYIDFGGVMYNLQQFEQLKPAAKVCCWCDSPIQFEAGNHLLNSLTCVCPDCADISDVKYYIDNPGSM